MSDYVDPIRERERLERTLAGFFAVAAILVLIVVTISSGGDLWPTAFFSVLAIIILMVIFGKLWLYYTVEKQYEVKRYLVESTRDLYFYGYSLADCLQSGVPQSLCWHGIGDFSKQFGSLVLVALRDSEHDPVMYFDYQESARPYGRYTTLVRFFYSSSWWQLDICERLDQQFVKRIRPRRKDYEMLKNWQVTSLWQMGRSDRRMYEACLDPSRSRLPAELWYTKQEADPYDTAYNETGRIIRIWQSCLDNIDTAQVRKYKSQVLS